MVFDSSSPLGKVQFQNRKVITFKYKQIKKEVPEFTGRSRVRSTLMNSPNRSTVDFSDDHLWPFEYGYLNESDSY